MGGGFGGGMGGGLGGGLGGGGMAAAFGGDPSGRFAPVRRSHLLLDGFDRLGHLGAALKGRVRVQFIDATGQPEAGVVGGGRPWGAGAGERIPLEGSSRGRRGG